MNTTTKTQVARKYVDLDVLTPLVPENDEPLSPLTVESENFYRAAFVVG